MSSPLAPFIPSLQQTTSPMTPISPQKARSNIYLVMEYCSGGDLSRYIRARGRVEGLEYTPYPGAAPTYWPHPKSGGLDPEVVRCFLGQLGKYATRGASRGTFVLNNVRYSELPKVHEGEEPDPSRHQAAKPAP